MKILVLDRERDARVGIARYLIGGGGVKRKKERERERKKEREKCGIPTSGTGEGVLVTRMMSRILAEI
jgi:hypothetical protein